LHEIELIVVGCCILGIFLAGLCEQWRNLIFSLKREYQESSLVLVCVVAQAMSSRFKREAISLRRGGPA